MSPSSSAGRRAVQKSEASAVPGNASTEPTTIRLSDRLDFAAARDLHARFVECRSASVRVDGSAVIFGGALAAQVLLSASRDWAEAGTEWSLCASPALRNDLQRLGLLGDFPNLVEVE
jgi:anti-anti-sigma regulatory factor